MRKGLIKRALIYNLDAHRANLPNLIAGAVGMIINNTIFFFGLWAMLFAGKNHNRQLLPYFIALNALVMVSWGGLNFFLGGLRSLGDIISEGRFEPMLATPRHPLLLAAFSKSHPVALGDVAMGLTVIVILAFKIDFGFAVRVFIAAGISTIAFAAVYIACAALTFLIPRGNHIGELITEITLSLSLYPTGRMFSGTSRLILVLSTAGATAVLPMEFVERASLFAFLICLTAAVFFLWASIQFFKLAQTRYQSSSYIGAQF